MPTIATAKATSTVASGHQTAAIAVVPLDQNLRMSRKRPQRGGELRPVKSGESIKCGLKPPGPEWFQPI